jgi:lambda family phage portal protein
MHLIDRTLARFGLTRRALSAAASPILRPRNAADGRTDQAGGGYVGAGTGRRALGWSAPTKSPNDVLGSVPRLRDRSRAATRNDPFAKAGINRLVSNVVGTGIKPMSQAPDPAFRKSVQQLWARWTDEADAGGRTDFYGLQALAVRTMLESGEAFIRLRPRLPEDRLSVPLQLQLLEPDFCPIEYTAQNGENRVRAGVEFNPVGKRVAYWMYRERPGDPGDMDAGQLVRIANPLMPAVGVIHLFDALRPGQIRGIPHAATVLLRLHDLERFDDATLLRQQLANLFVGFIKPGSPLSSTADPLTGEAIETDDAGRATLRLEPGVFQELGAGEEVNWSEPPAPAQTYGDFMRQQLMAVTAGLEVPYEVLTGDLSKVNDRTVRVILNEFRRRVEQWQHHVIVYQLCRVVWDAWFQQAILTDALPKAWVDNPRAFAAAKWTAQGWPYLHPVQDVEAQTKAIRAGLKSRAEAVSEQGYDVEDIDAEIAADNARADRLGLILDSDPRKVQQSGAAVTSTSSQREE